MSAHFFPGSHIRSCSPQVLLPPAAKGVCWTHLLQRLKSHWVFLGSGTAQKAPHGWLQGQMPHISTRFQPELAKLQEEKGFGIMNKHYGSFHLMHFYLLVYTYNLHHMLKESSICYHTDRMPFSKELLRLIVISFNYVCLCLHGVCGPLRPQLELWVFVIHLMCVLGIKL